MMISRYLSDNEDSSLEENTDLSETSMNENDAEQICEAIFTLIPEVSRLKELFLCWSCLDAEDRAAIDAQVHEWVSPERVQLYKPLREALRRWEFVQDTQGKDLLRWWPLQPRQTESICRVLLQMYKNYVQGKKYI